MRARTSLAALLACATGMLALPVAAAAAKRPKPILVTESSDTTPKVVPFGAVGSATSLPCTKPGAVSGGGQFLELGYFDAIGDGPTANGRSWRSEAANARGAPPGAYSTAANAVCFTGRSLKVRWTGTTTAGRSGAVAAAKRKRKGKRLTVKLMAVTSSGTAPGFGTGTATATCPSGYVVSGGGMELPGVMPLADGPTSDGKGWSVTGSNPVEFSAPLRVTAICVGGANGLRVVEASGGVAGKKPALRFTTSEGPLFPVPAMGFVTPYASVACPAGWESTGGGLQLNGSHQVYDLAVGDRFWESQVRNPGPAAEVHRPVVRCVSGVKGVKVI